MYKYLYVQVPVHVLHTCKSLYVCYHGAYHSPYSDTQLRNHQSCIVLYCIVGTQLIMTRRGELRACQAQSICFRQKVHPVLQHGPPLPRPLVSDLCVMKAVGVLEAGPVSCRCGPMVDLCTGPHLPNTGYLKTQAVNNLSRAFWRADVSKDPLQVCHTLDSTGGAKAGASVFPS